jgi:hypothetical protein
MLSYAKTLGTSKTQKARFSNGARAEQQETIIDKANRFDQGMRKTGYSGKDDKQRKGSKGQRNICNNAVPTRESGMNRMAGAVDQKMH